MMDATYKFIPSADLKEGPHMVMSGAGKGAGLREGASGRHPSSHHSARLESTALKRVYRIKGKDREG